MFSIRRRLILSWVLLLSFGCFTLTRMFLPAFMSLLLAYVVRHAFKPAFPQASTFFKTVESTLIAVLLVGCAILAWFEPPPGLARVITVVEWVLVVPVIGCVLYMDWKLPLNSCTPMRNDDDPIPSPNCDTAVHPMLAGMLLVIASLGSVGSFPTSRGAILMLLGLGTAASVFAFAKMRKQSLILTRVFVAITGCTSILWASKGSGPSPNREAVILYYFLLGGGVSCLLAVWAAFNLRLKKKHEEK